VVGIVKKNSTETKNAKKCFNAFHGTAIGTNF